MLARRFEQHPLETIDREFRGVLNRLWNTAEVPESLAPYAVDVHEDADHYYVDAELPGFTKDDVDITLEDGILTIRADKKLDVNNNNNKIPNPNSKQPLHVERRRTRFERAFTLPTAVKEDSVKASLDAGILTITLDKREELKPRRIPITNGPTQNGKPPVDPKLTP